MLADDFHRMSSLIFLFIPLHVTLILNLIETNISPISADFEEKLENNRKNHFKDTSYIGLNARKPSLGSASSKGADQPAHWRSLISTFVVRLLEVHVLYLYYATSEFSISEIVSVAEEIGLILVLSHTPKTGFAR